jgi:hypothetical protein
MGKWGLAKGKEQMEKEKSVEQEGGAEHCNI